jgi:endo-1,4-beta-xylanase
MAAAIQRFALAALASGVISVAGMGVAAGEATLASAAASTSRYFGAAIQPAYLDEKPYRDLVATQLTAITPENQMKWTFVEPVRGSLNWRDADALVAFAKAHGQKVRGVPLVWSWVPSWLSTGAFAPDELKDIMIAHITTEAGRYSGAIYAWDVVNEPFDENGRLRKSIWYKAMGPEYIAIALKAAHAADPDAKLYINEFDVETEGPKMHALYDLVAALKRYGVPIDGVGLQSHFVAGEVPKDIGAVMEKFTSLGVDVAVTELDLRIRLPAGARNLKAQADDYAFIAAACRATPRCVGITTWGITDRHSFVPSAVPGYGAALPFDDNYRPKPAVPALIEGLTGRAQ